MPFPQFAQGFQQSVQPLVMSQLQAQSQSDLMGYQQRLLDEERLQRKQELEAERDAVLPYRDAQIGLLEAQKQKLLMPQPKTPFTVPQSLYPQFTTESLKLFWERGGDPGVLVRIPTTTGAVGQEEEATNLFDAPITFLGKTDNLLGWVKEIQRLEAQRRNPEAPTLFIDATPQNMHMAKMIRDNIINAGVPAEVLDILLSGGVAGGEGGAGGAGGAGGVEEPPSELVLAEYRDQLVNEIHENGLSVQEAVNKVFGEYLSDPETRARTDQLLGRELTRWELAEMVRNTPGLAPDLMLPEWGGKLERRLRDFDEFIKTLPETPASTQRGYPANTLKYETPLDIILRKAGNPPEESPLSLRLPGLHGP